MSKIQLKAYAKINLFLGVTGKAPNGYHTVETILQSISLYDLVTVSAAAELTREEPEITLTCSDPSLPCDAHNLAWKAAAAYAKTLGHACPVSIHLEKRIPAAGGLAGGSADAAAVLTALNLCMGKPLKTEQLLAVGETLGADVPFCILATLGHPTALGRHFGEQMSLLPPPPPLYLVLAFPGESVATPWAYGEIDRLPPDAPGCSAPMVQALEASDLPAVLSLLYNRFEAAVLPLRPKADACKTRLIGLHADAVMMSGSGPTVFGIFTEKKAAEEAVQSLQKDGICACYAETLIP